MCVLALEPPPWQMGTLPRRRFRSQRTETDTPTTTLLPSRGAGTGPLADVFVLMIALAACFSWLAGLPGWLGCLAGLLAGLAELGCVA